ncbi:hypothetical protein T484DRAFT_2738370 [Baffinella frigidus]|nr:hypothetical protein T484DRAFT_2738370 [Cryptophyta sp. CCMP2293]
MEFRVFVERDGVGRQRDAAGQSRRKAVAGVLGLVCVAVLALASRGGDGTVEMAGKEYAVEENYETSFLEQAAALGNLGARTHERKTKLVPARRQDKTWGNVGARAERNIFGAAGAASGDAAVGHALSAVSKARAELRGLQKTSAFISLADAPAWKNAFAQKDTNVFDHSGDPTYLGADDPRLGTPAPSAATPLMADGRPGPRVQHPTDGGSGAVIARCPRDREGEGVRQRASADKRERERERERERGRERARQGARKRERERETPLMADGRPGPRVQHPTDGGSGAVRARCPRDREGGCVCVRERTRERESGRYIYIYIYIYREREREREGEKKRARARPPQSSIRPMAALGRCVPVAREIEREMVCVCVRERADEREKERERESARAAAPEQHRALCASLPLMAPLVSLVWHKPYTLHPTS